MFDNFKYTVSHNWSFMRALRLALGIIAIAQAIVTFDTIVGLLGAVLFIQGLFNIGCCGSAGCSTGSFRQKKSTTSELTHYEEIK